MKILTIFEDGSYLAFDRGQFDEYRVSFYEVDGRYDYSPSDTNFFWYFLRLGNDQLTHKQVWVEILTIAKQITKDTNLAEIKLPERIIRLSDKRTYLALFAAMIAEENKANAPMGKRVKLLGLHQVLIQKMDPRVAANWSKGKDWRNIDRECKKHGF